MPEQRLVEDEEIGIVRNRLRQLDALPHALAVGADLLPGHLGQIDQLDRAAPPSRVPRSSATPFRLDQRRDPFETGHPFVEGVLLGAEPETEIQRRIPPDRVRRALRSSP